MNNNESSDFLDHILKIIKKKTGINDIDSNVTFASLGINSLLSVQIIEEINCIIRSKLKTYDLFSYPTPQVLANYLAGKYQALNIPIPHKNESQPIAIIAMDCKYPDADNCDLLWENCAAGKESITFFNKNKPDLNTVYARGILNNIEYFDSLFFDYSYKEAQLSDPQHRLFIESAWIALEKSGYVNGDKSYGKIGVYASMNDSTYIVDQGILQTISSNLTERFSLQRFMSSQFLATRVGYLLDCTGPCINVQTACSSSLVAVVLACQQLSSFVCDIAIAGGVSIVTPQDRPYVYQPGNIHSPDGHCRPFDANAQGTVFSNGLGVVVLKRLSDALRDDDTIISVIKGYSMNNDGAHKMSYAAPSMQGQLECILMAQAMSGVEADSIQYIETHGTGTQLGDPIEIEALTKAFRMTSSREQFCALGSIKANIGHTHVAAGIAGLIKTSLALQQKKIPPTINFTIPNPNIDFKHSPFYVNTRLLHWPEEQHPRRAAVSAFGVGGTNAHVILEEAPKILQYPEKRTAYSVLMSAKSESALRDYQNKMIDFLEHKEMNSYSTISLADLSYTLQVGRRSYNYRLGVVGESVDEILSELKAAKEFQPIIFNFLGHPKKIIFVFSGENEHYIHQSRSLYYHEPIYQYHLDACLKIASDQLQTSLHDIFFHEKWDDSISRILYFEPILFSVEYALVKLLQHWGIVPDQMIGCGLGEYVAACIAHVFSLSDAIKLICARISTVEIFTHCLNSVERKAPTIVYWSGLTGDWITEENVLNNQYWIDHMLKVEYSEISVEKLLENTGNTIFVEVGSENSLLKSLEKYKKAIFHKIVLLSPGKSDDRSMATALKDLWCLGYSVDWRKVYANEKRKRVPLPTYPFQKQYFWFDQEDPRRCREIDFIDAKKSTPELTFYLPTWICDGETEKIIPVLPFSRAERKWIIFANESPLCQEICHHLMALGEEIVRIFSGEENIINDSNDFVINVKEKSHYEDVFRKSNIDTITHLGIIHFWGVEISDVKNPADFMDGQIFYNGLYGGIFIAQALSHVSPHSTVSWAVITTEVHFVLGNESINLLKNGILGLCRVLPLEDRKIHMCHIDVDVSISSDTLIRYSNEIIHQVTENFLCENAKKIPLISALRYKKRWALFYRQVDVPDGSFSTFTVNSGVYLITGGLGGMGMAFAKWLCEKNSNITIILLSRMNFPDQREWNNWIENHSSEDSISKKIHKLKEIVSMGCSVDIYQVDIADQLRMKEIISQVEKERGMIRGIFHLAGVAGKGVVALKNIDDVKDVLRPKIQGTLVLEELFCLKALDFFVSASSLTAIAGGVGQVDYCAANIFLDNFSEQNSFKFCKKILAINWNAWRSVGMAANIDYSKIHCQLYAGNSLTPEEGVIILERLLNTTYRQVIVSRYSPENEVKRIRNTFQESQEYKIQSLFSLGTLKNRKLNVRDIMKQSWQAVLGIKEINEDASFYACGGDSLSSLDLISLLQKNCGVEISLQDLMQHDTFNTMVNFIEHLL